jgi:hypothetical protein
MKDSAILAATRMTTILTAIREVATGAPHRLCDVQKGAILLR